MTTDTPSTEFASAWPGGYVESWSGYPPGAEREVAHVLLRFANPTHDCIEIGPGGGFWTRKYLVPLFHHVTCLDVIERPPPLPATITYHRVPDQDFSCAPLASASMDFAFSFGVFCHLSAAANQEYLHSLSRVLRPGAHALIALANWPRHPALRDLPDARRYSTQRAEGLCPWFYCDLTMARDMADRASLAFEDTLLDFRDTLALFTKPLTP
jgi:SAM-dependent methyltransferase